MTPKHTSVARRRAPRPIDGAGRTALVTGIGGQDGSYLAEHLLGLGYRVVGVRRGEDVPERIRHLLERIELVEVDLLDEQRIADVLGAVRPHEIYNLAGHSFVPSSWDRPDLLGEVTGLAAPRLLEAIRATDPAIRFYQASSSEIFGNALETPQSETTPLNPRNPYGAAKAFAHFSTVNAREGMGLFAVSGILYNHESPRRGLKFVSRKVSDGAARISLGLATSLPMGNLDAQRDWGFAGDYVRAMWLMLQHDSPHDYVIASGVPRTVRDLCRIAFAHIGLDYERHVTLDPSLVRPPEAFRLIGDPSRARQELGWQAAVSFEQLIGMMVDADVARHRAANG
jgi:GDPmannose 4,6-dehydratase